MKQLTHDELAFSRALRRLHSRLESQEHKGFGVIYLEELEKIESNVTTK